MNTTNRQCEYCHKNIDHRGPKAKTCGNTCKQYAMEVRQGKREPVSEPIEVIEPVIAEVDRGALEKQLAELEKAVIESNKNLMHLEEMYGFNDDECDKFIMENFRLREAKNDFLNKHFLNTGGMTGSDLLKYSTEIIRYPFEKIGHHFLENFGNPPQPFIATINGDANTGKTILGVLTSINLANHLGSEVLHVLDFKNKNQAIDYYRRTKSMPKSILVKFDISYNHIIDALGKSKYEFLILDSIEGLKLSYDRIKSIQRTYPKVSIFCIMNGRNKTILDASNIKFKTQIDQEDSESKSAFATVTGEGVTEEKNKVEVFYNDIVEGFKLG